MEKVNKILLQSLSFLSVDEGQRSRNYSSRCSWIFLKSIRFQLPPPCTPIFSLFFYQYVPTYFNLLAYLYLNIPTYLSLSTYFNLLTHLYLNIPTYLPLSTYVSLPTYLSLPMATYQCLPTYINIPMSTTLPASTYQPWTSLVEGDE